jgi:hypothetical protein
MDHTSRWQMGWWCVLKGGKKYFKDLQSSSRAINHTMGGCPNYRTHPPGGQCILCMHPCGVVCPDLQCSVLSCKQILLASFWVPKYYHAPCSSSCALVSSALLTYHRSAKWISHLYGVSVHNKVTYLHLT